MTYLPGFENPIGYVIGVRQWRYEILLHSLSSYYVWGPWAIACGDINKRGDFASTMQGIYAVKEEYEELLDYSACAAITGKVALWGKIAEHEKGYRAQYGYPLSFDHCTDRHVDLDQLRDIYLNPPTETTRAIVEERLQWISERKRERQQLHPSASPLGHQTARQAAQAMNQAALKSIANAFSTGWVLQPSNQYKWLGIDESKS